MPTRGVKSSAPIIAGKSEKSNFKYAGKRGILNSRKDKTTPIAAKLAIVIIVFVFMMVYYDFVEMFVKKLT